MNKINVNDFQAIEIKETGKHRVVHEDTLNQLIALAKKSKHLKRSESSPALGTIIKNYREDIGLKQGQLADKISLTRASMCNIEKGNQRPQSDTLDKLCSELGQEFKDEISHWGYYKKSA